MTLQQALKSIFTTYATFQGGNKESIEASYTVYSADIGAAQQVINGCLMAFELGLPKDDEVAKALHAGLVQIKEIENAFPEEDGETESQPPLNKPRFTV